MVGGRWRPGKTTRARDVARTRGRGEKWCPKVPKRKRKIKKEKKSNKLEFRFHHSVSRKCLSERRTPRCCLSPWISQPFHVVVVWLVVVYVLEGNWGQCLNHMGKRPTIFCRREGKQFGMVKTSSRTLRPHPQPSRRHCPPWKNSLVSDWLLYIEVYRSVLAPRSGRSRRPCARPLAADRVGAGAEVGGIQVYLLLLESLLTKLGSRGPA